MGPEAVIEKAAVDIAKAHGWKSWKLMFIGTRGAPDRIFGKKKRTVAIEFKAPGERPTTQQRRRHEELRSYFGWEVYWTDDLGKALALLDIDDEL